MNSPQGPHPSDIDIREVPHSGSLGLELPVREFDNTSLGEAVDRDLIEIPSNAATLDADAYSPATERGARVPELAIRQSRIDKMVGWVKRHWVKLVAGGASAGVVAGVIPVAVEAFKPAENLAPPAATAEPFPTSTGDPLPENTPVAPEVTEKEPTERILAVEALPSLEAFAALPKNEQLYWWSYLAYKEDIKHFAEEYQIVSENPNDIFPDKMDINALATMDIEDIIKQAEISRLTNARFALSFEPTSLQGQEAMHAVFADNESNTLYDKMKDGQAQQSEGLHPRIQASKGMLAQSAATGIDYAKSSQSLQYEGSTPYVDIAYKDGNVFRLYAVAIPESYIEDHNMTWLPDEQ